MSIFGKREERRLGASALPTSTEGAMHTWAGKAPAPLAAVVRKAAHSGGPEILAPGSSFNQRVERALRSLGAAIFSAEPAGGEDANGIVSEGIASGSTRDICKLIEEIRTLEEAERVWGGTIALIAFEGTVKAYPAASDSYAKALLARIGIDAYAPAANASADGRIPALEMDARQRIAEHIDKAGDLAESIVMHLCLAQDKEHTHNTATRELTEITKQIRKKLAQLGASSGVLRQLNLLAIIANRSGDDATASFAIKTAAVPEDAEYAEGGTVRIIARVIVNGGDFGIDNETIQLTACHELGYILEGLREYEYGDEQDLVIEATERALEKAGRSEFPSVVSKARKALEQRDEDNLAPFDIEPKNIC